MAELSYYYQKSEMEACKKKKQEKKTILSLKVNFYIINVQGESFPVGAYNVFTIRWV